MKEKDKDRPFQETDRHLDIPSEANRDKHINFLDAEDVDTTDNGKEDKETEDRQKQWQQGLEEGRKADKSE